MKGIGNYRFRASTERRPGQVVVYRGDSALVRFRDGTTYGMSSVPFKKLALQEGGYFVMVVTTVGKNVQDVKIELQAPSRPLTVARDLPKVYRRVDGKRIVTRK